MLITPTSASNASNRLNHALMDLLRTQGSTVTAKVVAVVELSEANIREMLTDLPKNSPLVKILQEQIQQAKTANSNPQAGSATPSQQNDKTLQLVKLGLSTAGKSATNWSVSDQKLSAGDILKLTNINGEIQFTPKTAIKPTTDLPASKLLLNNASLGTNTAPSTANTNIKQSALNSTLLTSSRPQNNAKPELNSKTSGIMDSGLRKYLPKQDTQLQFFKNVIKHSPPLRKELVELSNRHSNPASKSIATALQTISNWSKNVPNINQLSGDTISQAIKSSGAFLEQSLKQNIKLDGSIETNTKISPSLADLDAKSSLLATLTTANLISSNQVPGKDSMFDGLIKAFLSHSGIQQPTDKQKTNTAQALKLIESLALGSLARVTSNQLQSLSNSTTEGNWQNIFQTDVFIQYSHTLLPIAIQLHERSAENKKKDKMQSRDWRLFMEWEFPEYGAFSSEIKYVNERLSTKIWAEKPEIQQRFKNNINTLFERFEKEGIAVDNIHCTSSPLKEKRHNHKTLVDVRT